MNFMNPRFVFSRINYDFSNLMQNLPRKFSIAFLNKCKGKIVNQKSTKGREVNRGENISQDIILSIYYDDMLGYPGSPGLGSKVRLVGYYAVKGTDAYCSLHSYAYCLLV